MILLKFLLVVNISNLFFLPPPRKICLHPCWILIFPSFEYGPCIFKLCALLQRSFYIHMLRDQRVQGVQKKGKPRVLFVQLSVCMCISESTCPHVHTLTLDWAASLWSRWLLACLSFSSRSACRVAQREVNPSFSSSRASTTCRSSSCFLLLSVFISWIRELCTRRRVGGREGQINNGDWRRGIEKVGIQTAKVKKKAGEIQKEKQPMGLRLRWICKQRTSFTAGTSCMGHWLAKVTSAVWLGPRSQMLAGVRRVMPQELGSCRYRGQSVGFNDRLLMRMVHAARPIRLNLGLLWCCPPQFLTTRPHQDCVRSIPLSINHSQVPSKHN